jgi:phage baseplate assembly protein W
MASQNYRFFQNEISGKVDEIYDYVPTIGGNGDLIRISGINVLINSLRNLLLTPLGYYPFDPEYGSLLYKQLFEMADEQTAATIKFEIEQRVRRYDSRIKIDSVNVKYSNERKTAAVDVVIDRNGTKGKLNAILSAQHAMFGLEDEITAAENIPTNIYVPTTTSDINNIKNIFNSCATLDEFVLAMNKSYPSMSYDMILSYWNTLKKSSG